MARTPLATGTVLESTVGMFLRIQSDIYILFTRSRIFLLIFPISDLAGLIRWQVGLLAKLGLWFLRVMKASRLAVVLTRSFRSSLLVISLASSLIEVAVFSETFL